MTIFSLCTPENNLNAHIKYQDLYIHIDMQFRNIYISYCFSK